MRHIVTVVNHPWNVTQVVPHVRLSEQYLEGGNDVHQVSYDPDEQPWGMCPLAAALQQEQQQQKQAPALATNPGRVHLIIRRTK